MIVKSIYIFIYVLRSVQFTMSSHIHLPLLKIPSNRLLAEFITSQLEKTDNSPNNSTDRIEAVESSLRESGQGSHTVEVTVAGQPLQLIVDTGSGKTAFVCDGCMNCGTRRKHNPFKPTESTQYIMCQPWEALDLKGNSCSACTDSGKCIYDQKYIEDDYWKAYKASDVMIFPSAITSDPSSFIESRIEFGCIFEQNGVFKTEVSDGIMGFSQHRDSIFEQLYTEGAIEARLFSQCLSPTGGILTLGAVDLGDFRVADVRYTPLRDTGYQYWTVHMECIKVGDTTLDLPAEVYNQGKGTILDSGTTFVYLPTRVKSAFIQAWKVALLNIDPTHPQRAEEAPILGSYFELSSWELRLYPEICFYLLNNAQLCMGPSLYFYQLSPGRYAGTMTFSDGAESTIIGANALTNHYIIYDPDNNRVGMVPADCDKRLNDQISNQHNIGHSVIQMSSNPGGDTFKPDTFTSSVLVSSSIYILLVGNAVLMVIVLLVHSLSSRNTQNDMDNQNGEVIMQALLHSTNSKLNNHTDNGTSTHVSIATNDPDLHTPYKLMIDGDAF